MKADNLAIRGIPHNPICPLCSNSPETAQHLLEDCSFSSEVWSLTVHKLGAPFTLLLTAPHTANSSDNQRSLWEKQLQALPGMKDKHTWRSTICLVAWTLWKERNNRIFNATRCTPRQVAHRIMDEARCWSMASISQLDKLFEPP